MTTMTINGTTREVKNLDALYRRLRSFVPGMFYTATSKTTGESAKLRAYACATFVCDANGNRLVVCGASASGQFRYETDYASLTVFNHYTRKFLEGHGVSVVILGDMERAA